MTKKQMYMLDKLNCPVCAAKLEAAVRKLPGMQAARVEFGSGALHVEYNPEQLNEAAIKGAVVQAGVEVAGVMPGRASGPGVR